MGGLGGIGEEGKQIAFCNEVENDLGPDWVNDRDLTLVGLAGPFEAMPQPVSVARSCWTSAEVSDSERGVLELEEQLPPKCMFYLTPTAQSHIAAHCHHGQARTLSTCVTSQHHLMFLRLNRSKFLQPVS